MIIHYHYICNKYIITMTNNFDEIRKYVAELGIPEKYDTKCDL